MALLFLADARLSKLELRPEPRQRINIRVASTVVGPEAITFSGHPISYGPAPAMEVIDFSARVADLKQSFAQLTPKISSKMAVHPSPARNRKRYSWRYVDPAPRLAEIGAGRVSINSEPIDSLPGGLPARRHSPRAVVLRVITHALRAVVVRGFASAPPPYR
jgi:hypothetical protein